MGRYSPSLVVTDSHPVNSQQANGHNVISQKRQNSAPEHVLKAK